MLLYIVLDNGDVSFDFVSECSPKRGKKKKKIDTRELTHSKNILL